MKRVLLALTTALTAATLICRVDAAEPQVPKYRKLVLSDKFYCEGAYHGDFNRDGQLDVVAGPFWFEGPEYQKRHEIRTPQAYDPKEYSDNFLTYSGDFNVDGWTDVLYLPHPGQDAFWYENPGQTGGAWEKHLAANDCGNESPMWGDMTGDGRPELIYNVTGQMGYATWDPARPDERWQFHPITTQGNYQRYSHGIGFGDINGDGRLDMIESSCWWQQPADAQPGQPWIRHDFHFADAAAQMLVYDIDGDGLNDVFTTWNCHQYGLAWYKQVRDGQGQIAWKQNVILSPKPDLQSDALRVSQLHALDLADIDGDGLKDVVTGKRFWAHGPAGDAEPNAPAILMWFQLRRDGQAGAQFVAHVIDDDSGVGTQVAAAHLNGDKVPDVIVGNKKGVFVFLSEP